MITLSPTIEHLYLHIPFCARVCPYCSFYVHGGGVAKQERFVDALVHEIKSAAVTWNLKTLFIGGGTPSMLSAPLFRKITDALPPLQGSGEFTLEVNPATVTAQKMTAWQNAGVNRVSLGIQSFRDDELKMLGRQHSAQEAVETFKILRSEGFLNLNIDLIFGLPQQTSDHWRETLEVAATLSPNHLSAYQLTYEEDTPFFEKMSHGFIIPNEGAREEMFMMTESILKKMNLHRYEISNFSQPEAESIHNQAYWSGKDYCGFGPSAVSTVQSRRWTNQADTESYIQDVMRDGFPQRQTEVITSDIFWKERVMLGLRTRKGVLKSHFEERRESAVGLQKLQSEGLISDQNDHWCLTPEGELVADSVAEFFF